jgi:exonuclease III
LKTPQASPGGNKSLTDRFRAGSWASREVLPFPTKVLRMKVISWNIRGLKAPSKQRTLKRKLTQEKTDFMLLQETKCDGDTMGKIAHKIWKNSEMICIEAEGAVGGLTTIWNPENFKVEGVYQCPRILTIHYQDLRMGEQGYISNAYGPPNQDAKRGFLGTLVQLGKILQDQHWIIGGDFNLIKTLEEKKGGVRKLDLENKRFKEVLEELNLVDLPTQGGIFTWNNRRGGIKQVVREARSVPGFWEVLPTLSRPGN